MDQSNPEPDAAPGTGTQALGGGVESATEPGPGLIDNPQPAADVPPERDFGPGAPEADNGERQAPRLGEGGAAPGAHDPTHATGAEPVTTSDVAEAVGGPQVGGGRAVEAAFAKRRPAQQQQQRQPKAAGKAAQQQDIQGAGYPTADRDGRHDPDGPPLVADSDLEPEGDPEEDAIQLDGEEPDAAAEHAPVEDGVPEEAPVDVSVIGDGHADKAAWNRERTTHPQPGYDEVVDGAPGRAPGSSEDMGYPGGAPSEDAHEHPSGLETVYGRLDELAEEKEGEESERLDDAADALDDASARASSRIAAPAMDGLGRKAMLPDERHYYDEGVAPEERVIAQPGEDPLLTLGEMGDAEDLEMESLNEQDDIAADLEDQRALDDAASGNERQTVG